MEKAHEFLQLGYLSSSVNSMENNLNYQYNDEMKNHNLNELLTLGRELLLKEVAEKLKLKSDIIVPISGGLDSRLLLSAIAECKDVGDIKTYTFGSPGALDYEIGEKIGTKIGTDHRNINLMEHNYKLNDLYKYAEGVTNPTIMFHNLPTEELELNEKSLIASGFLGDVISGKRLGYIEGNSNEIKRKYFNMMTERHSFSVDNNKLISSLADNTNFNDLENITEIEKIYLLEHNFKMNFNQVVGYMRPDNVYTPFLNTEFMNFLLSLPYDYRINQYYYKKLIFEKIPSLFGSIPVKNFSGTKYTSGKITRKIYHTKNSLKHRLSKKNKKINSPLINYVDFKKKIQRDNNFKNLLLELMKSLKERDLPLYNDAIKKSIYEIEKNNIINPYNYLLLSSLEIYFRQGRISL